jgi:hypothetical protein
MTFVKHLKAIVLVSISSFSLVQMAHADAFSDRLRNDPTAVPRQRTVQQPMTEPEITRSLRQGTGESNTPMCSYDMYYWNTIYACDPAHQGLPDRDGHDDQIDQGSRSFN